MTSLRTLRDSEPSGRMIDTVCAHGERQPVTHAEVAVDPLCRHRATVEEHAGARRDVGGAVPPLPGTTDGSSSVTARACGAHVAGGMPRFSCRDEAYAA